MDKRSVDLAKAGLEVYDEFCSPHYDELRQRLNDSLSAPQLALEGLRHATEQANANIGMLVDFAGLLPGATCVEVSVGSYPERFRFIAVDDLYTAKAVQSSIVWGSGGNSWYSVPRYVIGHRQAPGKAGRKWDDILLLRASEVGIRQGLTTVRVRREDYQEYEATRNMNMMRDYTEHEIQILYNQDDKQLHLEGTSPGSVVLLKSLGRKQEEAGKLLRTSIRGDGTKVFMKGVSDRLLAEFGVFHYINRLATVFDKVDALQQLLEQRQQQANRTPAERILDDDIAV